MSKTLPKIFVQIASYRDPECQWTIKDLFEKATYPERVNVGICWQFDKEEDQHCFEIPYPRPEQVRVDSVEASDSLGTCWARAQTQKLWDGEEYTLQIDSHMRFEQGWDETLINMLGKCDSDKPILTTYPSPYTPPNNIVSKHATILVPTHFDECKILKFEGIPIEKNAGAKQPIEGIFVAGGFIFSSSDIISEVPYDPYLYFDGEEITLAVRYWTHGWDIYHPNISILYHYYDRVGASIHSLDNIKAKEMAKISISRVAHILGIEESDDENVLKEINRFGIGTKRSLQDYKGFSGIDFKAQKISDESRFSRSRFAHFLNDSKSKEPDYDPSFICDFVDEVDNILVISFGFYSYGEVPKFDFLGRLKKIELRTGNKINKLLLRDKKSSWYQYGIEGLGNNIDETAQAIQEIIDKLKPSKVFTIGQSMGGYAAIMFGALLKVDTVIAFGSMAFFDLQKALHISDSRWLPVIEEFEKNLPDIFYNDLNKLLDNSKNTKIKLYYGTEGDGLDSKHAKILENSNNVELHAYKTDHLIVNHLKDIGKIDKIIATTLFGEDVVLNDKAYINDSWKEWVAENILNGADADGLISIMAEKGLDENESRSLVYELANSPHISIARKLKEKLERREWLLKTLDWHQRHDESYTKPQKVPLPPFEDFLRDYYYKNKIGIFSGGIDHWESTKWSFDDLVEKVGYESIVEVQKGRSKDAAYELNSQNLKAEIKFGEFIDQITSGESSNDVYMTANNQPFKNPAMQNLLSGFGNIGDNYFDMDQFEDRAFLWLGPKGVITPLHHDLTNNFFVQIKGKKLYHLIPPMQVPYMSNNFHVYSDINLLESDLAEFPEFKNATVIEVELDAGDCLFIPIGCWHHVVGLTENISMTLTNFNVKNSFPTKN